MIGKYYLNKDRILTACLPLFNSADKLFNSPGKISSVVNKDFSGCKI
jgi:hypothetical protein